MMILSNTNTEIQISRKSTMLISISVSVDQVDISTGNNTQHSGHMGEIFSK